MIDYLSNYLAIGSILKSENLRPGDVDLGIVDMEKDKLNEALANSNWNKGNNKLYAENRKNCEFCKNFKPY